MAVISATVEFLAYSSVFICLFKAYLSINKTWRRKHVKDVAESNSVMVWALTICTSLPMLIKFSLIEFDLSVASRHLITIGVAAFFFLVASGYWVKGYRKAGLFRLVLRALRLERRESTDLLKAFLQPRGAQQIEGILYEMATVDKDLDEREIELLRECAAKWNIDPPETKGEDATAKTGTEASMPARLVAPLIGLLPRLRPARQATPPC